MVQGIEGASFEDTGYSYTLSLIRGEHKMSILYCLMEYEPVRFNEMRRYLGGVSDRTLSRSLKELEADGLVSRREFPRVFLDRAGRIAHGRARSALRVGREQSPRLEMTAPAKR